MHALNLPQFEYQIKHISDIPHIWDIIRKKYVQVTPEEWVRQHFIHYLINENAYPKGLISCEKGLEVNTLKKRSDILVYNRAMKPFLLIECKSADIKIDQKVFQQAAMYNKKIGAPNVCVTNGLKTFCFSISEENKIEILNQIPPAQ